MPAFLATTVTVAGLLTSAGSLNIAYPGWPSVDPGVTSAITACRQSGCNINHVSEPLLYVQFTSSSSLLLAYAEEDAVLRNRSAYRIVAQDPGDDKTHHVPHRVGYSTTVVGFDEDQNPLLEYRVHVEFATPLLAEIKYRLEFPGHSLEPAVIAYSEHMVSPTIQVNQVGFLPDSRKTAFVGNWLGDAGPMTIRQRVFQVINAGTMATAYDGRLTKSARQDHWSGNNVYHADFGPLKTPGKYFIRVPGLGRSDTFVISKYVYEDVFRKTFRLFYHSRNSTAIEAPYAEPGYERPSGVPAILNGFVHHSATNSTTDHNAETDNYRPIEGGWFDAGDYGQYVVNAAPVWHFYSTGFDIDRKALSADNMRIPESGNNTPDMIDELEWGMKWMLGMQDKSDGGVYSRLVPVQWDDSLPHDANSRRYFFEKTTHATAAFVAATAIHSRLTDSYNPAKAAAVRRAAEQAWAYLESTPPWPAEGDRYRNAKSIHAGEYPDKSSIDNRLWAAAELYRTTGNKHYYDAFIQLYPQLEIDATTYVSFKDQALAACWAMLMARRDGRDIDSALEEKLAKHITDSADWLIRKSDEHPYRAAMHQYPGFTGWGSFAQSTRAIIPLLQAYKLTGQAIYPVRAKEMTNPQLGANPLAISYITGIGKRYPRYPLSKLSGYDGKPEPLPGIPVNGPHFHLPALWSSTKSVNNAYYPSEQIRFSPGDADYSEDVFLDAYPALRRYVDSDLLPPMSEPTVSEYAQTVVAYGLLGSNKL